MNKRNKRSLLRIIISSVLFALLLLITKKINFESAFNQPIAWLLPCLLWFALYLFIAYDVILKAIHNLFNGQIFDENFLMVVASFGAFCLGVINAITTKTQEGFDEAVAVIIFYQVGQLFERLATEKSRKSISELLDIRPDYAHLLKDNQVETVFPDEVESGQTIVIYPGEKVPLDCTVVNGCSTIDNKSLTGESLPVEVFEGCSVLSGSLNLTGEIKCEVTKPYYEGTVAKILDLVENASDKKSKSENFIEKFAKYYTPIVLIFAFLTALLPPIFVGNFQTWLYRALSFLVVSCPCALVISVPMTFFVALGKASRSRILVKGSNYLELLAKANVFVFDKTGTLTNGNFEVSEVYPPKRKEEVLKTAAIAEKNSSHPIAKSIVQAFNGDIEDGYTLSSFAGFGVMATNGETVIHCGNENFFSQNKISLPITKSGAVYVAKNGEFLGYIVVKDSVKSGANEVIDGLLKNNCTCVMLTGDQKEKAEEVANECNITTFKHSLLPQDKVFELEKILAQKKQSDVVCFVGDGINDAPALMRSDVGIAMGAMGSDAAIESADVVLMKDSLEDILIAKKLSLKALNIVKQNIVFSISIKVLILILSLFGITNMWFSIFGDVGVAVLAILNALRVGIDKKQKR